MLAADGRLSASWEEIQYEEVQRSIDEARAQELVANGCPLDLATLDGVRSIAPQTFFPLLSHRSPVLACAQLRRKRRSVKRWRARRESSSMPPRAPVSPTTLRRTSHLSPSHLWP